MRVTNTPTFKKPVKSMSKSTTKKPDTVIPESKGIGLRRIRLIERLRLTPVTRI